MNCTHVHDCMFVWVCPEKRQWEVANYIYAHVHLCIRGFNNFSYKRPLKM